MFTILKIDCSLFYLEQASKKKSYGHHRGADHSDSTLSTDLKNYCFSNLVNLIN